MKIVTAQNLGSKVDYEIIDGLAVSFVKARNVFSTMGSGFKAVVGGNLGGLEKLYESLRTEAIIEITNKAKALGADAIIAFRIDITDIPNVNGVSIFAYGTAVKILN